MKRNDTHCINCGWRPTHQVLVGHGRADPDSDAIRHLGARMALNERPHVDEYALEPPVRRLLAYAFLTAETASPTVEIVDEACQ